jgi:hypothetical protein
MFRKFRDYVQDHSAELFVFGIGTAISLVIALAATGNLSDAIAGSRRK